MRVRHRFAWLQSHFLVNAFSNYGDPSYPTVSRLRRDFCGGQRTHRCPSYSPLLYVSEYAAYVQVSRQPGMIRLWACSWFRSMRLNRTYVVLRLCPFLYCDIVLSGAQKNVPAVFSHSRSLTCSTATPYRHQTLVWYPSVAPALRRYCI